MLKRYIEERAIEVATYITETKATVRETAKKFSISKSTVHKDVTERLLRVNPTLAREARLVLEDNKSERHIRGGQATKKKYALIRDWINDKKLLNCYLGAFYILSD